MDPEKIRCILLIQLGDIGDVVVSLPCVRALKENFPGARVVVAIRAKAREIMDICPWADDVVSIEQPRLRFAAAARYQFAFFREFRAFHADLVFDLRAGTRGAILARLSGAPLRIGFYSTKETFWRDLAFTHLKPFMPDPNRHQSLYYQSLLMQCGIPVRHRHPEIALTDNQIEQAGHFLSRQGVDPESRLIAVHPFALWRYKEWPLEKTTELVRRLTAGSRRTALILGSSAEHARAQTIIEHCDGHAVNLAGKTTLDLLAAILRHCLLLIGMDSAVGHIGAAVSTPCVTIFGPGKPGVWAPLGNANRIVHQPMPCIHCGQKGCDGSGRARCLEMLSVDAVHAAVLARIAQIGSTGPEYLTPTVRAGVQEK
ncbi:glycosyltransferase family 9 protein [uncultured Desulfosarcina sp.]|uniref:glycosyltransferase family 9 protein n=1 Tax=uncultured Desulfosarcina sp. TaxID=218289 RepID=UPI0029C90FC2|nr:glycosyltransferase family 9 protein [uncultured Desulfosarcina sp.]